MPASRLLNDIAVAEPFADAFALARGLTSSTGVMIAFFDRNHRIAWANDRFAEWFGVTPTALVGRTIEDVYGHDAYSQSAPRLTRAMAGEHVRYERLLEKLDSPPKWISVSLYPHRDPEGEVLGVFACSIEVDELRRTRDALDRSMQEIAIYLDNSPLAVIEWDSAGKIRRWAGQAERVFGWTSVEVAGGGADELNLVHPDWIPATNAAMRELMEGHIIRNRVVSRNITKSGRFIYCEWFHSAFVDRTGSTQGVLSLAQDITARTEAEEQLRHAAIHDALTGCHNRRYLINRIEHAITRARRTHEKIALLFIDLDRFKPINDTYGHAMGDAFLKAFAALLQECVRETDTVARVGGDEFVILMETNVAWQTSSMVRERIVERLALGFTINDIVLATAASIGEARFPEDGDTADQLLRHADETMYREKSTR
jgi:diguanylate cyclase (GGDEF)-like protein/PAS domain S-box-containing protein